MPVDADAWGGSKKKLTGWAGVAAAQRTRKARTTASKPARDPSKRNRINPKMTDRRHVNIGEIFPKFGA